MQRLFIRLADSFESRVHWLVVGDSDGAQAEGSVDVADLAGVVADQAPWADDPGRVVAFVPTADVVALRCEVPGRTSAQLRRAVRYAAEPFVTEDIDTMHVACGPLSRHEPVRCLVTPHESMRDWLDMLGDAGIVPGCLTPDAMALPADAHTTAVLFDGEDALVRTVEQIASVDAANLAPVLGALRAEGEREDADAVPRLCQVNGRLTELDLRAVGYSSGDVEDVAVAGSVLAYMADVFDSRRAIDLLQGEYQVKRRATGAWARWRAAAAVAAAWLVLGLALAGVQGVWATQRAEGLQAEAAALYREIYSVERAPPNPAARMRVRLGQAPESRLGFHRLLGHLGRALNELPGEYELRSVSYNERSGFGADVLVADYDVLDRLKATLADQGLALDVVSAEQHESRARASLRIADDWAGEGS